MTDSSHGGLGRASTLLLVTAVAAAATVLLPWAHATGSTVPDSAELTAEQAEQAGAAQEFTGHGAAGALGAVLLVLAGLLVAVALWRLSPKYRPAAAGYLSIVVALLGVAGTLWFLLDEQPRAGVFASSVQLQADTVSITVWPWLTLACFALACVPAVLLVPGPGDDSAR